MPSDNKTIEVRVKFWTDNLTESGEVNPKHAWAQGVVHMPANTRHGIKASQPQPFNSMAELASAIEDVLAESGIRLHVGPAAKKKLYEI